MLDNVSSSVFTDSHSITLLPVVSAEWNHNLFNSPYMTVAGNGTVMSCSLLTGTVSDVTSGYKPNFTNTTKSFDMSEGKGSVSYTITANGGTAYKVITYVKTNNSTPVMVTGYGKGSKTQFGSESVEADSLGWTKIITYVGSSGEGDTISSFIYTINANDFSGTDTSATVYFTVPQVYETTFFDYQNHTLWPSESPFEYFRPGESYVLSGNTKCLTPSSYRKITSSVINNYTTPTYAPISSIVQNPSFILASSPVPVLKNAIATDISAYKYFVSDPATVQSGLTYSPSITAIYEKGLATNKLVIKFNTIMTIPTFNLYINDSLVTATVTTSATPPATTTTTNLSPLANSDSYNTGVIILYWTGTNWTTTKWSDMPKFNSVGALTTSTTITKITITQIESTVNPEFSDYNNRNTNVENDLKRMHLIEISPRLEIDLTDYVENVTINKSLDSANTVLPISSINTNDAVVMLSGIPEMNGSTLVPIFSTESSQTSTVLANMLRKNVKVYINFNLVSSSVLGTPTPAVSNTYIPGGIFYADSWQQNGIENVAVQCFDVSRYLQSKPVPDYVANLKSVFDIITNILDLGGFTDYDYDGLYAICNNKSSPIDLAYYYCNSKDLTIIGALNKIFLAYQIGAYIDEYGIMKFLSLSKILDPSTSSSISITESNIVEGGFSVTNTPKPGKISLRYQTPKIKQSPGLQNTTDPAIQQSPSFIYTTSNDVVWQQQTLDSVGFNYLNANMLEDDNVFTINKNDVLDIFHTYNLDNNGYAAIEDEIVSFLYKEYTISNIAETKSVTVSVKSSLELSAEINRFIQQYTVGLQNSFAIITDASGDGETITYVANNIFKVGDKVNIVGIDPKPYNIQGTIIAASSTSFEVSGSATGTYLYGGDATISSDYDVKVEATGRITNIERGMFGTVPREHKRIAQTNWLESKGLSESTISDSFVISSSSGLTEVINDSISETNELASKLPSVDKIQVKATQSNKTAIYPTNETDNGYSTYSVKFDMPDQNMSVAGLFFNMESTSSTDGAYFVELTKFKKVHPSTNQLYDPVQYRYTLTIYDSSETVYAWCDVSGPVNKINDNFPKILTKTVSDANETTFSYVTDNAFNLKVVLNASDGSDGEDGTTEISKSIISVFLNNYEITSWQIPGDTYDANLRPAATGWKTTEVNPYTGIRKKPSIDITTFGTKFGFYASRIPQEITNLHPQIVYPTPITNYPDLTSGKPASVREIHATQKPLLQRSANYFYQDREFLNGMLQGQPLASNSPTYIMQTTPEISGINVYDVQYTTPAAVSVDVYPISYLMLYFPGNTIEDQKFYQEKLVDEYSLSYSSILNTGFRAKMIIANSSPHLVFLQRESDEIISGTSVLNLWTHGVIAPSDPEIIERIVDQSNPSEVVQLDSEWIQSKIAANKILKLVEMGLDGFSKQVSLTIFGNPLIQIGDIVTLSYYLNGITQQRYLVYAVSHTFEQGLSTKLNLKRIQQ